MDLQAKHVCNPTGLLFHDEAQPFESHYKMNLSVSNLALLQPSSMLKLQQSNQSRFSLLVLKMKCRTTILIQLQPSYSSVSKIFNFSQIWSWNPKLGFTRSLNLERQKKNGFVYCSISEKINQVSSWKPGWAKLKCYEEHPINQLGVASKKCWHSQGQERIKPHTQSLNIYARREYYGYSMPSLK